ncbi:Nramp family divalent metal transporter [Sphingomonas carotinifaciens]|uniref:Divalent metal cation transporter n=1 Tax=Sphingomonas carotinifaciens TaxID=1166323 RepID=A0A1G7IZZ4_9SPHN|nr:Nramp family divalent metal transporter [Sphingomonas carotinifaciens]MBB4084674.1 Mn2+/Fe2+ NRAMP family transporter [Sphingomonas carotinifaciens]MWC44063.1 divalent metal cation transporter [Sphingomonas carotinifaciens]SDF18312.1 Mn2+ and Fe2+ transporters of the NRAMP family [Sphingomonas carotinifaciens]
MARNPLRVLGTGIITGAADDDPSAIGTYATAGARFGLGFLWIAPVLLPMMYVVVYVSAKLGRVYGKGLFAAVRDRFPRWVLYPLVACAFTGNVIEAAANLGGIGAALALLVPVPVPAIVVGAAAIIVAFQIFGSYDLLRTIFRWLALALFAYVAAAIMARPDWGAVLRATVMPRVTMDAEFLAMVVACIGTSLSAYIYTWQSNQEVEEQIAEGRTRWRQRFGASRGELERTRRDVIVGMLFSNVILYFIILSTGATLHPAGQTEIESAAQAASALEPLAGPAAKWLFAAGVVGVGFLAVPVMSTGAAYDLVQGVGREGHLNAKVGEAKLFYAVIVLVTIVAVALNFLGFNPMRALVWSGIVQGFSVPPLLCAMMIMTGDRRMMGARRNGWLTTMLGWITVLVTFAAAIALIVAWAS